MKKRIQTIKFRQELQPVTVCYRRADVPIVTTRVGYGKTIEEAITDADSQLSDGVWTRTVVSTLQSVFHDLQGNNKHRNLRHRRMVGEGKTISVEKRISEVILDD